MIVLCFISFLAAPQDLPFQVFDLDLGKQVTVSLAGDTPVVLRLDSVEVVRDPIREAVRYARVWVLVDGERFSIACGNYEFPLTAGRCWLVTM